MKILSFHIEENMLHVITDNELRPEFVYPADKFTTVEALTAEIEKSIRLEGVRVERKTAKIDLLANTLDSAIAASTEEVVK